MSDIFEDKALQSYLGDISKYSSLSREEEKEIAIKAKAGDICAKNKLIISNLKFVVKIASKYQNMGLSLAELISDGNLGLITAIEKFDPEKNNKLISYAVWWIRQKILCAINQRMLENSNIKIVEDSHNVILKNNKNKLMEDDYTEIDPISIFYNKKVLDSIKKAINELNENESYVVKSYFGLDGIAAKSCVKLGNELGVSKEFVRKIKNKSIKKILHKVYEERENEIDNMIRNIY